jgi:Phage integrase family
MKILKVVLFPAIVAPFPFTVSGEVTTGSPFPPETALFAAVREYVQPLSRFTDPPPEAFTEATAATSAAPPPEHGTFTETDAAPKETRPNSVNPTTSVTSTLARSKRCTLIEPLPISSNQTEVCNQVDPTTEPPREQTSGLSLAHSRCPWCEHHLALKWGDIDFEARTISIRRSLKRNGEAKAGGKKEAATRTVVLFPQLDLVLSTWKEVAEFSAASDYVICTADRKPITSRQNARRAFESAEKRASLPLDPEAERLSWHSLRHSAGSMWLNEWSIRSRRPRR